VAKEGSGECCHSGSSRLGETIRTCLELGVQKPSLASISDTFPLVGEKGGYDWGSVAHLRYPDRKQSH
jgi:hypothetical protein